MIGVIKLTKICKVTSKCLTVTIHQHHFPSPSQTPGCPRTDTGGFYFVSLHVIKHLRLATSNSYHSSSMVPHMGANTKFCKPHISL